jgi:hypothetical protein
MAIVGKILIQATASHVESSAYIRILKIRFTVALFVTSAADGRI